MLFRSDEKLLFKLSKGAFGQRRKTILNNYINTIKDGKLHKDEIVEWLNASNIDPKRRGETLTIQEYAHLCNNLKKYPNLSV